MNEPTRRDEPEADQPQEIAEPVPGDGPSGTAPVRKFRLTGEFVASFLGWYLAAAIFYGQVRDQESQSICGGLLFPVNLVLLFLLFKIKPQLGWGMLAALGLNMVVSLGRGLLQNAFCFIPFFSSFQ